MTTIRTLITDFDNTLYDWAGFHIPAFRAMLESVASKSGIPQDQLIAEFKEIHQKHGTTEYAFSINELPSLKRKHPNEDIVQIYGEAIEVYRKERSERLALYPGVKETLETVHNAGCLIVVYTESMAFYSNYRVRYFNLDLGLVDRLYSPPDHDLPLGLTREQIRRFPASSYELRKTVHDHTPKGVLKPNEDVLRSIITSVGAAVADTLYVGDSLAKDVVMAQRAGVREAWAKYGEAHRREDYDLLRAVTHWTDEMVQRERELTHVDVKPRVTLETSFSEILEHFDFGEHSSQLRNGRQPTS